MKSIAALFALLGLLPAVSAQDAEPGTYRQRLSHDACDTVVCWDRVLRDDPQASLLYYSAAMRAHGRGWPSTADSLLGRALGGTPTAAQRQRFFVALESLGKGPTAVKLAACLGMDPTDGACLLLEAGLKGDAARAAAGNTVEGRAAYWCMADIYRDVAAVSSGQTARAARRAAAQYERAGPTREQYFFSTSWRPGRIVTASLGEYGECTTRVR